MAVTDLTRALSDAESAGARPAYRTFRDYYDGRHQLRFATAKFQADYGQLVLSLRENLCPAVVAGFTDDLAVQAWGDAVALDTATEQGLSRLVGQWMQETWKSGDGYVMVWPNRQGVPVPHLQTAETGIPQVDPEDPAQLAQYVKRWIDPRTGHGRAMVLFPDHAERYITVDRLLTEGMRVPNPFPTDPLAWAEYDTDGDAATLPHAFGSVPVCWLPLDASAPGEYGRSILTDVIPIQDALNKSVANMVVLEEDYAEPFWFLLKYKSENQNRPQNPYIPAPPIPSPPGVPPVAGGPENPAQLNRPGEPRFDRRRQSIFTTSAEGPMDQFDPPDLTRLIKVQDSYALKVARVVGLPSYYVTQTSGDVPSGEALRVVSTRRTGRLRRFQNAALPVLRGLGQLLGMQAAEPEWQPIQLVDEGERWIIAQQQHDLGLGLVDVLEYAGVTDAQGLASRATVRDAQIGAAIRGGNPALFGD